VAVPVLNWEHYLQDDYLMTGAMQGVDWGSAVGQASLIVTNQGHPLAGGLADGVTSVASSDFEFPWGHPNPAAAVIAGTLNDGSGATCLYGYEVGAMLIDGSTPAPARRVQFFLTNDSFGQLNSAGLAMFDAAVGWAMDRAVPGWFQPPLLQGGLVRLEWVGGIEVQAAPAVTGVWATVPGVLSPMSLDPTNPAQFFRVKP
jgi:hypothetical protein